MRQTQETAILRQIYQQNNLKRLISIDRFYAALYNEEDSTIEIPLTIDEGQDIPWTSDKRRYRGEDALPDCIIAMRKPLVIGNLAQWVAIHGVSYYQDFADLPASWMGVPLLARDRPIGVIVVENRTHKNAYGREEERLLMTMAGQVAVALENARNYRRLQELQGEIADSQDMITRTKQGLCSLWVGGR